MLVLKSFNKSANKYCLWLPAAQAVVAHAEAKLVRARQVRYRGRQEEIRRTGLQGLESARKIAKDNCARLFASRKAHLAELSDFPLSKADIMTVAREEAQKLVDAEIQAIKF